WDGGLFGGRAGARDARRYKRLDKVVKPPGGRQPPMAHTELTLAESGSENRLDLVARGPCQIREGSRSSASRHIPSPSRRLGGKERPPETRGAVFGIQTGVHAT